ncbi:probable purine permease 10 isoform X2 [Mangifera indica]|uniref:probable purine permease 10 isoform X2 n=1 Tax=Mangifera indica TaxID=29780 RepID=UPI001CF93F73|nr:probable purine permease 10 isoform X2 [Mangifera indica]
MGRAQQEEVELHILGVEAAEGGSFTRQRNLMWWIRMAIYTIFVLVGQTAATLLGRLYYDKGGNSKWLAGLMLTAGFPVLVPFYFISSPLLQHPVSNNLQLSTYSLLCASQLAFNAFFSFFLNSLKFTFLIINSLTLLTISSILLIFQTNDSTASSDDGHPFSKRQYAIGFICTIAASALYGLLLSLTQWFLHKVAKKKTVKVVLDMIIYPSLVASCVIVVGLFASGEWKGLSKEMAGFKLGKVSYLMTLIWTAVCWEVFSVGSIGLIFEVSSVFSNVISTLGLPVVPVLAVAFFRDQMSGVKVLALILAVWGFVSYVYQHYYLDDHKAKIDSRNADAAAKAPIVGRNDVDENENKESN